MKILKIHGGRDSNHRGDWLVGDAAQEFINGNYTHVRDTIDDALYECEVFPSQVVGGEDMVMIGRKTNG